MLFRAANVPMPTTAAETTQTTGTAIRTMLQVAVPSTKSQIKVVAWAVQFAGPLTVAATVELVETDVAATGLTAHVASGVQPWSPDAIGGTSDMTLGTGATGYTNSTSATEGTITATRQGKTVIMQPGESKYEWEWPLGREFLVQKSKFLRVRCTTSVSIGLLTWTAWDE